MAAPTLQAEGTVAAVTTGNLTVTLPAHQLNDILVVVMAAWVPNTTTGANVVAAPAGWTKLDSDTLITSSLIDGEWAIFWKRAAGSAESNPAFTRPSGWDTGTDTCWGGRAYVIRGAITSGNPWDANARSALHSAANGAFPAVTVSGTERTVIQFLASADNQFAGTVSGWTAGTAATDASGTDCGFQTFRKVNVSSSTTADASTTSAPAQGRYIFFGISFVPEPATPKAGTDVNSTTTEAGAVVIKVDKAGADSNQILIGSAPAVSGQFNIGQGQYSEAASVTIAKAGTDVNGATTETGTLAATAAGTDVNGAKTETATLAAALTGTDVNGAVTEAGTVTQDQALTGSDTGTGADTSALTAIVAGSDTGTATETAAYTFPFTATDTGAGTDTGALSATLAGGDTGTAAEAADLGVAAAAADTGTATETGTVTVPVTGSDEGSGVDASALAAALQGADEGAGADTGAATSPVAATDTVTVSTAETATVIVRAFSPDDCGDLTLTIGPLDTITLPLEACDEDYVIRIGPTLLIGTFLIGEYDRAFDLDSTDVIAAPSAACDTIALTVASIDEG